MEGVCVCGRMSSWGSGRQRRLEAVDRKPVMIVDVEMEFGDGGNLWVAHSVSGDFLEHWLTDLVNQDLAEGRHCANGKGVTLSNRKGEGFNYLN